MECLTNRALEELKYWLVLHLSSQGVAGFVFSSRINFSGLGENIKLS